PVEGVVPILRGIVEDGDAAGIGGSGFDNVVEGFVCEVGIRVRLVKIVDISAVMLAVMKADRRGRNYRDQRVVRVRQWRQQKRAGCLRKAAPGADRSERAGGQYRADQPAARDRGSRGPGGRSRCVRFPEGPARFPANLPQDLRYASSSHLII